MFAAYVELRKAQKVKEFLIKKKLMHQDFLSIKELGHIYFPLVKRAKIPNAKVVKPKFTFPEKPCNKTVADLLKGKLTKNQLEKIPRAQEVVGSILILEIPEGLGKKEKVIAEAYLKFNKNVETVVKKTKIHSGVYRTRKVKILVGNRTKETIHHENGIQLKLHLEKTYFSARSANERLRLARLVKKGEEVLVMFSGAAPFLLVIAKNSNVKKMYGVELNPLAHQYALKNVILNKLGDKISIYQGNVREIVPSLRKKFDRIAMPLPKSSDEFLDVALPKVKKGGVIHLYAFLNEAEIDSEARKIRKKCKELGYSVRIMRKVKCGQFSPGTFRICYDIKVT